MGTQKHIEDYINMLAFVDNNEQEIVKTFDPETEFLYRAHLKVLSAKCYRAISAAKLETIKNQINQQLNDKISKLEKQQKAGFDASLLLIATKEEKEIEALKSKIAYLDSLTEEEIVGLMISKINIESAKILENELLRKKIEKLSRIKYNNVPCSSNDRIDYVVIEEIYRYIEDNDLLKIKERVNQSLLINKTFQNLALLKRNAKEIINTKYLEIYEEKIENLKSEIKEELKSLSSTKYSEFVSSNEINLIRVKTIIEQEIKKPQMKLFTKKSERLNNLLRTVFATIDYEKTAEQYEKSLIDFEFTDTMDETYKTTKIAEEIESLKISVVCSTGTILRNIELEKENLLREFKHELDEKTAEENNKITEIASKSEIEKAKDFNLKIDENGSIEKVLKFLEGKDKLLNWLFISLFSEELNREINSQINMNGYCEQILQRIDQNYNSSLANNKISERLGVKPDTKGHPNGYQKKLKLPNNTN